MRLDRSYEELSSRFKPSARNKIRNIPVEEKIVVKLPLLFISELLVKILGFALYLGDK